VTDTDLARLSEMARALQANRHPYRQYAGQLEAELARARVVPRGEVEADVVTMNSTIRIREQRGREVEEFTLVYPNEADALNGRLSVLAPLGMAVLGARVGDVITWRVPAGERTFRVERIVYQPEAAGDVHL